MSERTTDEAKRWQAQELAYSAMESYDPEEALRLSMKALELDPRCTDALTLTAGLFEPGERVAVLRNTVRMAEEDMGGDSFFEANKGHFWGILETRPYMRARSFLAQTLHEAGETKAAIKEYEAMLDLNPGDNQGLRDVLMGLYLGTDDLKGVQHLFDEYGEEESAVFAWSALLERLISDDFAGAEKQLAEVRRINPYVEGYLLGRKPMPDRMPDYYSYGDESEAIVSLDFIGTAWRKHPKAIRWLLEHEIPSQASGAKVGRNDPCPCGSGRKYKKCCMDKEETPPPVGSQFAAEKAMNELHQAMQGKNFSSVEEMNAFIQEYNQRHNRRPVSDFKGLSPEQMHRIISFPFESPEVVEFPDCLDNEPSAPVAVLFSLLADAIGEGGLKPTVTGNLPLKVVREITHSFLGDEKYEKITRYGALRSETDSRDLHFTRIVAELAGLIRKYKGRFILSRQCRKLLKNDGMKAVYPLLLRAYADKFNWAYSDYYPDTGHIQHLFAYTLYLLSRYGDQWRENTFYEDAFFRAFSSIPNILDGTRFAGRDDVMRQMYSYRTLEKFAGFMGLVEIDKSSEDKYSLTFKLRATPLLADAVRFHI